MTETMAGTLHRAAVAAAVGLGSFVCFVVIRRPAWAGSGRRRDS